ncbi:unnamed protein product [Caenorhabditis auriculariae]|uniref:Uncharacterized protein n=1 Tax=Caenorhabditis auriculariae TaxID=2777116 RepID=A0A8S1HF93_9PELO|nr:unnamed protein product [Caenorhabditis auriculariae]
MTKITGILFFFTTFYAAEALKCYDGWQIWGDNPVNNVTLVECLPFHKCCYFVASLPGNNFGCYEKCPPVDQPQCGPDPKIWHPGHRLLLLQGQERQEVHALFRGQETEKSGP